MPLALGSTIRLVKDGKNEALCNCDGRNLCPAINFAIKEGGPPAYETDETCYHGRHIAPGELTLGHILECTGGKFFYAGMIQRDKSEEHYFALLIRNPDLSKD